LILKYLKRQMCAADPTKENMADQEPDFKYSSARETDIITKPWTFDKVRNQVQEI
jgi:hypothetical protein